MVRRSFLAELRAVHRVDGQLREVRGEAPHVRSARAVDPNRHFRVGAADEFFDHQFVHANVTRDPRDGLPRARQFIQFATVDLDRRHHRRDLCNVADEGAGRTFDLLLGERHLGALEDRPRRIQRVGCHAEHDTRPIGLSRVLQVPQQPRRASQTDEQNAGRVGIERSRVADAALPVELAHPGDDVVRGVCGRFVYDNESIMQGQKGSCWG